MFMDLLFLVACIGLFPIYVEYVDDMNTPLLTPFLQSSPIIERVVVMAVVKVEFRGIRVLPER